MLISGIDTGCDSKPAFCKSPDVFSFTGASKFSFPGGSAAEMRAVEAAVGRPGTVASCTARCRGCRPGPGPGSARLSSALCRRILADELQLPLFAFEELDPKEKFGSGCAAASVCFWCVEP